MTAGSHDNFAGFMDYMDTQLRVFSPKYLEGLNVVLTVLDSRGISTEEFKAYTNATILLHSLEARGYFDPDPPVSKAVAMRQMEREIPNPALRRYARRLRLNNTAFTFHRSG